MSQTTPQQLTDQFKDLMLNQQNDPNVLLQMNIDKTQESKKGYWSDDEPRGISLTVSETETGSRISLSSEYWYRVQHFDLTDCDVNGAWQIIQSVASECGRTLVPHLEITDNEENAEYYRVAYLNPKQTDQLYYLLKHSLTTLGIEFVISHTLTFDKTGCVRAPVATVSQVATVESDIPNTSQPSRRRRRKNRSNKKVVL